MTMMMIMMVITIIMIFGRARSAHTSDSAGATPPQSSRSARLTHARGRL